jgi:hypothetical protein
MSSWMADLSQMASVKVKESVLSSQSLMGTKTKRNISQGEFPITQDDPSTATHAPTNTCDASHSVSAEKKRRLMENMYDKPAPNQHSNLESNSSSWISQTTIDWSYKWKFWEWAVNRKIQHFYDLPNKIQIYIEYVPS